MVVQVLKEPMGTKGARITSHVSLPGRYIVLMPTVEHVGVSRKITDEEERRRLKTILKEFRQERGGGGLIARTAGHGREAEAFLRDGRYLSRTWDEVRALAARQRAPVLLYREPSLLERLLRDLLSDDVASIRLDSEREFQRTLELVRALEPSLAPRVRLHDGPGGIMEEHGVSAELERALRSKVWLPAGGYIVINQTEALVAIDVNTGRFVGKNQLEETLLKANLDAVREIVRQIRLRDLGGIIVVDFIDMEERKSRREVMHALEQEMRKDRSPTKLLSVNEFGLVILTRKRVKQSLERLLMQPCPYCSGSGQVKSVATVCSEIYDEVRKLAPDMRGQTLVLRVNPEVARALEGDEAPVLKEPRRARRRRGLACRRTRSSTRSSSTWSRCERRARPSATRASRPSSRRSRRRCARGAGRSTCSPRATSPSPAAGTRPGCLSPPCSWRSTPPSSGTRTPPAWRRAGGASRSSRPGRPGRGVAARETERASLPEVAERLDALRERLEELPGRAAALPLAELAEVSDLVAVASRPNWDYLRERLRRIDELVAAAAVEALAARRTPRPCGREADARAAERHRGRRSTTRALDGGASSASCASAAARRCACRAVVGRLRPRLRAARAGRGRRRRRGSARPRPGAAAAGSAAPARLAARCGRPPRRHGARGRGRPAPRGAPAAPSPRRARRGGRPASTATWP